MPDHRLRPRPSCLLTTLALAWTCLAQPAPAIAQQNDDLAVIRANMPRVVLDQLVYPPDASVSATVTFVALSDVNDAFPALVFGTESSGDVEVVNLTATADPLVFEVSSTLVVVEDPANVTQGDGVLSLGPGEVFSALLSYKLSDRTPKPGDRAWAGDWGVLLDPAGGSPVSVRPGLVLTDDELNPPPGLPPIGTLFIEGEPGPVQVAAKEVLFLPRGEVQLGEFLARTGGTVVGFEGSIDPVIDPQDLPKAGEAWLRVTLDGDPAKIAQLPQLRALAGEQMGLTASSEAVLALVATTMELWCEGYLVSLHPRMQLHGDLYWPDGVVDSQRVDSFGNIGADLSPNALRDDNFGIRKSWAFLAMFDFDQARIPVGVIDSGFAPNPDFRTGDPLYAEANLATGATGIGSARVPQEVGNSFFGDKAWHGNGTVTTIAGIGGNRFGTAGTGGQVAVPKLYHMGLANFALGFGTAIRRAVDDGCSVVNISAGYPCRVLSVLGNDNICSPDGRAFFAFKLGAAVRGAAAAACGAAPLLDAFLPGLGAATCATAIAAAETASLAIFSSVFLGETRTPVERGVEYATAHGVPVVASAGNRLSDEGLGALGAFVNNENSNIDDWQVIPAVIPEVIAVGACVWGDFNIWNGSGLNFYANLHFWGDSVDIWAPIDTWYWAPEPGEADPATIPSSDHIRRFFGGTSCAAPFITGIIANLMAVNPALDRRFADPATWPSLPGQIRGLLVDTAHQAGDPSAPDSADDRVLFEENDEGELEEIDEPQELLDQLERRRNYVNAWAALQQAAADIGFFDYAGLAYETDLGMDDRLADIHAPDGVLEPTRSAPFSETEEISLNDEEFWFLRTPPANQLYQVRYTVTLPLWEVADRFFINGRPGTSLGIGGDEQTVTWISPNLWRNAHFPTTLSGRWGADTLYKFAATIVTNPLPPADSYDFGFASNETLDEAPGISAWVSVPPRGLLEVEAFELCVTNLNFHTAEDVDVFRIEFPNPPIEVPFSCGALEPWVTFRIEPPNGNLRLSIFSRAGGSDTLLARGSGSDVVRLDCLDYLGHLPLHVTIDSASGSFAEYDLKVRWSVPDAELGGRLDRIREAHAGGREIPGFESFFRPEVPWLRASPGLLPDFLVNPNPEFAQALGPNGEFLASRLFLVEVPKGTTGLIGFMAVVGAGQSLRIELVGLFEQTLGFNATPDLLGQGQLALLQDPGPAPPQTGPVQYLPVFFQSLQEGTYVLRLSGHRPGDQIALYLTQNLVPPGTLSIESYFDQQGQYPPTPLGLPPAFADHAVFGLSGATPSLDPGAMRLRRGSQLKFFASAQTGYQVEVENAQGVWEPFGSPVLGADTDTSLLVPRPRPGTRYRVSTLGGGQNFVLGDVGPAYHLLIQSRPQTPHVVTGSATLAPEAFAPFNGSAAFTGTGDLFEWFYAPEDLPAPPFFLRLDEGP